MHNVSAALPTGHAVASVTVLLSPIGCTDISRVILASFGFFKYLSIDEMLRGMPMLND